MRKFPNFSPFYFVYIVFTNLMGIQKQPYSHTGMHFYFFNNFIHFLVCSVVMDMT